MFKKSMIAVSILMTMGAMPTIAQAAPQTFAQRASLLTAQDLPYFASDLLKKRGPGTDTSSDSSAQQNGGVSENYILNKNDEVSIALTQPGGVLNSVQPMKIDNAGEVVLPQKGALKIAGMTASQAAQQIEQVYSKEFRNVSAKVVISQASKLKVTVTGFATDIGSYTVAPNATVLDVLIAANGINPSGSYRMVSVFRKSQLVGTVDLYQLAQKGASTNLRLQDGDIVNVPKVGAQIAVYGANGASAIYELKTDSISTTDFFTSIGLNLDKESYLDASKSVVYRYNKSTQKHELIKLPDIYSLEREDVIVFNSKQVDSTNVVQVRGSDSFLEGAIVAPFKDSMTVLELIKSKDSLRAKNTQLNQTRSAADATTTQEENSSACSIADDINWKYATIERTNPATLQKEFVSFNLEKAMNPTYANSPEFLLKPKDVIVIYSQKDLKVPIQYQTRCVKLEGEVAAPGVYSLSPTETLTDVIQKAGGLTDFAYPYSMTLSRAGQKASQKEYLRRTQAKLNAMISREDLERKAESVSAETAQKDVQDIEIAKAKVAQLSQIEVTGRVSVNLDHDATASDLKNKAIKLEHQDVVYIPPKSSSLIVAGSVFDASNTVLFEENKTVDYFVAQVGGEMSPKDNAQYYIVQGNGIVKKAKPSDVLYAGDNIFVMQDVTSKTWLRTAKDWTQILYQFGMGAAGLATILK